MPIFQPRKPRPTVLIRVPRDVRDQLNEIAVLWDCNQYEVVEFLATLAKEGIVHPQDYQTK